MGLSVAWLRDEAGREGEVALFDEVEGARVVGGSEGERQVAFLRQRPGRNETTGPLAGVRPLMVVEPRGEQLAITPAPGRALRVDGTPVSSASVGVGAVVAVADDIVLVAVRRPAVLPGARSFRLEHPFGEPDAFGWAGESAEAWRLRDTIALAARSPVHVLVEGPSGVGKGIAARALCALSPRADKPVVVCSNGALPGDDELLARASGGTLIVDPAEVLTPDAQARFLHFARTQRIESLAGEFPMQVRLVVLARRLEGTFGNELRSRFLSLTLPGFQSRREDLPLILRARALAAVERTPELGACFTVANVGGERVVRVDGDFVEALLRRSWTAGGFEMDRLLWRSMTTSDGNAIMLTDAAAHSARGNAGPAASASGPSLGAHLERLGVPSAQHWGEVRVRPVDGLTVLVTVRTRSARCSHVDLGLASAKSRGPTKAWELLIATCEGRGTFAWRQFGETRDTVRKQVERLSEALCSAVGLQEAPFEAFDPHRGWVAKFLAVPER